MPFQNRIFSAPDFSYISESTSHELLFDRVVGLLWYIKNCAPASDRL